MMIDSINMLVTILLIFFCTEILKFYVISDKKQKNRATISVSIYPQHTHYDLYFQSSELKYLSS